MVVLAINSLGFFLFWYKIFSMKKGKQQFSERHTVQLRQRKGEAKIQKENQKGTLWHALRSERPAFKILTDALFWKGKSLGLKLFNSELGHNQANCHALVLV